MLAVTLPCLIYWTSSTEIKSKILSFPPLRSSQLKSQTGYNTVEGCEIVFLEHRGDDRARSPGMNRTFLTEG